MTELLVIKLLTVGLVSGAIGSLTVAWRSLAVSPPTGSNAQVMAQAADAPDFPDIQDHWARPFIRALAQENIVSGYLDGTFQPERPMERDEFAAIVRQAFDEERTREIASGDSFQDVPEGNWAVPAIEEAYEMGFVSGYDNGDFRPEAPISKVDAIVSLMRNLNYLNREPSPVAAQPAPADPASPPAAQSSQTASRRTTNKRPLLFPLASTALLQPFVTAPARASALLTSPQSNDQSSAANTSPSQTGQTSQTDQSGQPAPNQPQTVPVAAATVLNQTYTDAGQVPQEAIEDVAAATEAGVVVNYPDPRVLNPNQPATRAEVAALIHQALVREGRLEPIPNTETASGYVARPNQ